jgi:hypothetical protein
MLQGGSIRRHILDGHVWNAGTRYLLGAMRKVFEDLFAGKWACAEGESRGVTVLSMGIYERRAPGRSEEGRLPTANPRQHRVHDSGRDNEVCY